MPTVIQTRGFIGEMGSRPIAPPIGPPSLDLEAIYMCRPQLNIAKSITPRTMAIPAIRLLRYVTASLS